MVGNQGVSSPGALPADNVVIDLSRIFGIDAFERHDRRYRAQGS